MRRQLVRVTGLSVDFPATDATARAVDGVDLAVAPGEALGIVGESGSGKSVTWLAALGLLPPRARVSGSVRLDEEELVGAPPPRLEAVRGKRIAMIFQDPSSCLNPVHRIGWQLAEALRLHRGLDVAGATAESLRLLDPSCNNWMIRNWFRECFRGNQRTSQRYTKSLASRCSACCCVLPATTQKRKICCRMVLSGYSAT